MMQPAHRCATWHTCIQILNLDAHGATSALGVGEARGRPRAAVGSAIVSGRARIDVKLSLDGVRVQSETTYAWASPYVLSVHTVIPQPDLAIELHSTFTGHPGTPSAVTHLTLGPPRHAPVLTCDEQPSEDLCPGDERRALLEQLEAVDDE
jgi:hypothetical protein